ncbi:MAG: glucosamine-6-phosphate deaminase [Clostridia bacterium]|nr:glucosamine-6-phosphate deaminase [Clostridia bacterium]
MKIIETKNYAEMSKRAADLIAAQVLLKPDAVLGLATGSTPIGLYDELVRRYEAGELDFSAIRSVNLDEYCGLDGTNDQSYRYFMNTHLFDRVNIDPKNTNVPNGKATDFAAEGERYDALIRQLGGIDIQLLGIGLDGHIGFNEPDDAFTGPTHEVKLDPSTIAANARFFASEDEVPRSAITMGMASIMQARRVLLVANGNSKAEILKKALFGPITPQVPASLLQLHPDLTVIFCGDDK